jgi:two-component system, cell cycle response regulator
MLEVAEAVRQHHERIDGRGYPLGLSGSEIRVEARIVAVCDSWAAMLADRPYHTALTPEQGRAELLRCRGAQFDAGVVDAFLELERSGRIGELRRLGTVPAPRLVT